MTSPCLLIQTDDLIILCRKRLTGDIKEIEELTVKAATLTETKNPGNNQNVTRLPGPGRPLSVEVDSNP